MKWQVFADCVGLGFDLGIREDIRRRFARLHYPPYAERRMGHPASSLAHPFDNVSELENLSHGDLHRLTCGGEYVPFSGTYFLIFGKENSQWILSL